jgi:hypothetical protein
MLASKVVYPIVLIAFLVARICLAASSSDAEPETWNYEAKVSADGSVLWIDARFPSGSSTELSVESGTEPFLREVSVARRAGWATVEAREASWFIDDCARGCRIRYRFELAEAASKLQNPDTAARYGDVFESPLGAWLLRPLRISNGALLRLRVRPPKGIRFATGLPKVGQEPPSYQMPARHLAHAPYAAFGPLQMQSVAVQGGMLQIALVPVERQLSVDEVVHWISDSASAVGAYFGRFPLPDSLVLVVPSRGARINGRVFGGGGATVLLWLGPHVSRAELDKDWVLVHELTHLGFPSLPRRHHWAEEGLATYLEPIIRARARTLPAEAVWAELVRGLPKGLPQPGDQGLDYTPTWGRTYWGGALFWFLADVEIRERTGNQLSLQDALRGILAQGGTLAERWSLERAFSAADRAIALPVLERLHERMGASPAPVDLDALFDRLGVRTVGTGILFDDRAPIAPIRRGITVSVR